MVNLTPPPNTIKVNIDSESFNVFLILKIKPSAKVENSLISFDFKEKIFIT